MNPDEIMHRVAAGDHAALESIVTAYRNRIVRYTQVLLGDYGLADDATQNTFIAVWKHAHTYRGPNRVGPWIYRIAYQQAIEILRHKKRRSETSMDAPIEEGSHTIADTLAAPDEQQGPFESLCPALVERLPEMLDRIDPRSAEAVRLRFLLGLTLDEIAMRQGIHYSSAARRVERGLFLLRRAFATHLGVTSKKPPRSTCPEDRRQAWA